MPEYEHPGVYVEEMGSPKPIDGVPTGTGDALTWLDGPHFFWRIVIAGVALAALGTLLAIFHGRDVIAQLIDVPGGSESLLGLIVSVFVLAVLRAIVDWRRRKAGRPELKYGRFAVGVFLFSLANLAAVAICLPVLAVTWAIAPAWGPILFAAGVNVLVGGTLIGFAGGALRDLLLLVQAARSDP